MKPIMREIEKDLMKPARPDSFNVGDTVNVHLRYVETVTEKLRGGKTAVKEKERIQIFSGTVICIKGGGMNESFTVRRLVQGEGVERTFPMHAPVLHKVEVIRKGKARRAKLYYLRDRIGKATKVKERFDTHKTASADVPEGE